MAKKTFKIGEYAIGGIITVNITGKVILIKALNMYSKEREEVSSATIMADDSDSTRKLDNYLNELTSCFYAEKVTNWIKNNITLIKETRW